MGDRRTAPRHDRDASRGRVLDALRAAPEPLTVADVAAAVGLHANTVRFHLERLLDAGQVELYGSDRTSGGRPRLTYRAVDPGTHVREERNYRLLAEILTGFVADSVPDPGAGAMAAGIEWGGYLARRPKPHRSSSEQEGLDELVRVLTEVGFDPRPGNGHSREIALHHCPFREAAQAHQDVVCAVHLGLMRGLLSAVRAPVTAERLEPFVAPSLCMAYLSDRPPT
jgi:predicted ArsR family transcriptional regulator